MTRGTPDAPTREAIAASWERCERQHKLARDAAHPILRLQTSEIAPRLAHITERTGGRQGFFRQLAAVTGDGKRCLVVTDAEGVLVRLESADPDRTAEEWNGIALGSCWDERIAGTNGVSMALRTGRAITIRGADHFYARLKPFACTGAPILDADGALVGSVNLVTYDLGAAAEHHFARQFLETAADRIQRRLFEQHFAQSMLISVSAGAEGQPLSGTGLIAVDEAGIILGATAAVARIAGDRARGPLTGQAFQAVFDLESDALAKVPERVLSMPMARGAMMTFSAVLPQRDGAVSRGPRPAAAPRRRRLPPSLRDLAVGCKLMAARCAEAEMLFRAGVPFLIDGETGTGKSALIAALAGAAPVLKLDCATMGDTSADTDILRAVLSQARVLALLPRSAQERVSVLLDNIAEMPREAQAELRRQLDELEAERGGAEGAPLRVVGLSRRPLADAVAEGLFRDDLYYLLAGAQVSLPPLRARRQPEVLAQVLATKLAGRRIDLSDEAAALIRAHLFPGNLRELRAALARALLSASGDRLTPVDFGPTSIVAGGAVAAAAATDPAPMLSYDEPTRIRDALTSSGWNVSEAARRLGMSRATINRKIKRHGLSRPS
ncbi:sigma-54-dependent Fis family transcriptional regulator [Poseidonocella sedimentorum]|uniref:Transcriptional regulator of acetoin/glycerol metabolism n=1 Tax=Poseidonocella sedimentorum TaxID=871652 RepID=A0A1I6ELT9_9RHOB|nr:sigma 54-interacting transcriptional regulator [Poseidonocella sedimentorum]SFR18607.1 Transcriptional regulator of acetoin/glycerol metabolism [Poseidonocella sedimentorum]